MYYWLKHLTYTAKEKAFVGFWSTAIGSYLVAHGMTYHALLHLTTLYSVLAGVVTHQVVYWVANTQKGV